MLRTSIGLLLVGLSLTWASRTLAQIPVANGPTTPDYSAYPLAPPSNPIQPPPAPVNGLLDSSPEPASGYGVPNIHIGFEGLIRWFPQQKQIPLITSGPSNSAIPAAIGQPGTQILVNSLDANQAGYGGRLILGYGVESRNDWAIQGSGFWLSQSRHQTISGTGAGGTMVLARPFYNVVAATEDADPAAFPQIASGKISVQSDRDLYGADAFFRYLYIDSADSRMVLMAGFNFVGFKEGAQIEVNSDDLPGVGAPGNQYYLREKFTANSFYTGALGIDSECRIGSVFVKGIGKVSIGGVNQVVERTPYIQITEPSGNVTRSSDRALYISPANAGRFSRTDFAVIPEGSLRVGIDFNQYVQLSAAYSVQYLNSVARPADQIDRNVIVQPVGTPDTFVSRGSAPSIHTTDLFLHGLDVTLRLSF